MFSLYWLSSHFVNNCNNTDSGVSTETALEDYNKITATEQPQQQSRNGWLGRGVKAEVVSGFYIDDRPYLCGSKKAFLVLNPGLHSDKFIVVRPNTGRYTLGKDIIRKVISEGKWRPEGSVTRATQVWENEWVLTHPNTPFSSILLNCMPFCSSSKLDSISQIVLRMRVISFPAMAVTKNVIFLLVK